MSWEKFDADKACEDVDMQDIGPISLDSKKSQADKMEKLRDEAQHEKERGNNFVKQEKWDEAIRCYNRAIELVKDDAIYYANRGLCHLKKDNLHQAETDCTEALRLDSTYVKALQRRASARERLGSLRGASSDLTEVLTLEPRNKAAQTQLDLIKARMGTKGTKSKSSPTNTPTSAKSFPKSTKDQPKIVEIFDPKPIPEMSIEVENWKNGVGENVTVLRPVKKPPHLRSKKALKSIAIQEIPLGKTSPEKPPTRLKIVDVESDCNKENEDIDRTDDNNKGEAAKASPESIKLIADEIDSEKESRVANLVAPVNSVQFMSEWKYLKGSDAARSEYFSLIEPAKISSIFSNALESAVVSEALAALHAHPHTCARRGRRVGAYLAALASVKRFSALAMFLSAHDKLLLKDLLDHCKKVENMSDNEIDDLKNKYEL